MSAVPINYFAVVIAAITRFLVGWGWYTAFGKIWQDALGKKAEDCKPTPLPFIVAAVGCLLMAWMLAGLMGHLADVTVRGGVIGAFFVWVGFVLTTTATNEAFHGTKPIVTAIDAGHWLAVLVVMGAIIGAFGA
jgi:Protein of unknown function (DUF1761)